MINYMKSEIYRILRKKSTYLLPLGILLFLFAMLGLTWYNGLTDPLGRYNNTQFIYMFSQHSFFVPLVGMPFLVNLLFGGEFQNGTLKNALSYGVGRPSVYFGKFIISALYGALIGVIVLGLYILGVEALMINSGGFYLRFFIFIVSLYGPLLLASLAVAHGLRFVAKSTGSFIGYYMLLMVGFPMVLEIMAAASPNFFLVEWFPYYIFTQAQFLTWGRSLGIMLIYFTVSSVIALNKFTKMDI